MSSEIKAACRTDLGFPYHGSEPAAARLDALQRFIEARGFEAEYLGAGPIAEELEEKIAGLLGAEAALWCPTGTMAQMIAARIHAARTGERSLLLHPTSHLLLHEEEGYARAHGFDADVRGAWRQVLSAEDIETPGVCVFLETPQRHSGGRLPSWAALAQLKARAHELGAPLHMDGARLWSCRPHFGNRSYAEICDGFSSVYVSLYKDIGAMGGAMLAGAGDFIAEARIWRARLGGLTAEPWLAMADALRLLDRRIAHMPDFVAKARSMAASIADLGGLRIHPDPPHVNMFHVLLPHPAARCEAARDRVAAQTGIWLSNRFWAYESETACALEIVVGETALATPDSEFRDAIVKLMAAL